MPENIPHTQILDLLSNGALDAMSQDGSGGIPSMPPSNDGLAAQFFGAAHEFYRLWIEARLVPMPKCKPCVVVLTRSVTQDMERLGAKRVRYFQSDTDTSIGGKVFLANNDMSIVAEVPTPACGSAHALGDRLEALGLQDYVHCILLGHRSELILCRDGIDGTSALLKVEQRTTVKMDGAKLDERLWQFHRQFTQTPSGVLRPWKNAKERITIDEAELRISLMIGYYLGTILGQDNVEVEDQRPHGRIDVMVSRHSMVDGLGACALECKVLRSREIAGNSTRPVSAAKMIAHATDGVQQAIEYRLDLKGTLAYLCCFDARETDEDQTEIVKLAADGDVSLRRYFMYNSPKAHRDAKLDAKKIGKLLTGEVA